MIGHLSRIVFVALLIYVVPPDLGSDDEWRTVKMEEAPAPPSAPSVYYSNATGNYVSVAGSTVVLSATSGSTVAMTSTTGTILYAVGAR